MMTLSEKLIAALLATATVGTATEAEAGRPRAVRKTARVSNAQTRHPEAGYGHGSRFDNYGPQRRIFVGAHYGNSSFFLFSGHVGFLRSGWFFARRPCIPADVMFYHEMRRRGYAMGSPGWEQEARSRYSTEMDEVQRLREENMELREEAAERRGYDRAKEEVGEGRGAQKEPTARRTIRIVYDKERICPDQYASNAVDILNQISRATGTKHETTTRLIGDRLYAVIRETGTNKEVRATDFSNYGGKETRADTFMDDMFNFAEQAGTDTSGLQKEFGTIKLNKCGVGYVGRGQ